MHVGMYAGKFLPWCRDEVDPNLNAVLIYTQTRKTKRLFLSIFLHQMAHASANLYFQHWIKECFKKIKKPNKSNKQTNKKRNKTKQNKQVRKTKILHRTVSYKRTDHVPSYTSVGESIAVYWLFRTMLRYRLAHIVHMICTANSVQVSRS